MSLREVVRTLLSWIGKVCADGTVLNTAKRQEDGEVK